MAALLAADALAADGGEAARPGWTRFVDEAQVDIDTLKGKSEPDAERPIREKPRARRGPVAVAMATASDCIGCQGNRG